MQDGRDDWSEGLGVHESIPLLWMEGPGSCGEQEARAAGQVAHPHEFCGIGRRHAGTCARLSASMEIEDGGLPQRYGRGKSRDSGATDPSERGTSEARAAQAGRDDWFEGLEPMRAFLYGSGTSA
jgi:hypothetical protein